MTSALAPEVYRALEDIVGAEHVADDPAVLDGYAFQYLAELVRPENSPYMPRPAAVVMPATTEEVQAVVLLANRHGLKVKATGTGWYFFNAPIKDEDQTLQLDLRRMNAILEIDEQNLYAVVEPYVIHAQLQAETLKRGSTSTSRARGAPRPSSPAPAPTPARVRTATSWAATPRTCSAWNG